MQSEPLKLGFIGGGLNSAVGTTHRIAAEMDKRWKVVAGCFSTHEEINRATAELWGIEEKRRYDNWKELLASEKEKRDAIAILTPTPSHADIVIETLNQGYDVICEKALAVSSSEACSIKQASEKTSPYWQLPIIIPGIPCSVNSN